MVPEKILVNRGGNEAVPGGTGEPLQAASDYNESRRRRLARASACRANKQKTGRANTRVSHGPSTGLAVPLPYRRSYTGHINVFSFLFKSENRILRRYPYRGRIVRIAVSATFGTPIHQFLPYQCYVAPLHAMHPMVA